MRCAVAVGTVEISDEQLEGDAGRRRSHQVGAVGTRVMLAVAVRNPRVSRLAGVSTEPSARARARDVCDAAVDPHSGPSRGPPSSLLAGSPVTAHGQSLGGILPFRGARRVRSRALSPGHADFTPPTECIRCDFDHDRPILGSTQPPIWLITNGRRATCYSNHSVRQAPDDKMRLLGRLLATECQRRIEPCSHTTPRK